MRQKESEKASEPKSSHAESDSHYQLRLFLFHFTASSYWQSGTEGETKRQFSSNRITHQNMWDECAMESQRASWTQCGEMKIYAFNRKHGMNKGLEKERKRRSVVVRGGGGVLAHVFLSSHLALIPRYPRGTAEAEAASKGSVLSLMSH